MHTHLTNPLCAIYSREPSRVYKETCARALTVTFISKTAKQFKTLFDERTDEYIYPTITGILNSKYNILVLIR